MESKKEPSVWIDGDSCPAKVHEFVFGYVQKRNFSAFFVTNTPRLPANHEKYQVLVPEEKDAADSYIIANAKKNDLIITKDIVFAATAFEQGFSVINDRGFVFSKENIKQKLADREYDLSLAQIGFKSPREKSYGKAEFARFVAVFEKEMKRLVREAFLV